jgi:hypothetical protein
VKVTLVALLQSLQMLEAAHDDFIHFKTLSAKKKGGSSRP